MHQAKLTAHYFKCFVQFQKLKIRGPESHLEMRGSKSKN